MRRKSGEPERTRHLKMALGHRKDETLVYKAPLGKSQDINPLIPELDALCELARMRASIFDAVARFAWRDFHANGFENCVSRELVQSARWINDRNVILRPGGKGITNAKRSDYPEADTLLRE